MRAAAVGVIVELVAMLGRVGAWRRRPVVVTAIHWITAVVIVVCESWRLDWSWRKAGREKVIVVVTKRHGVSRQAGSETTVVAPQRDRCLLHLKP